MDLKLASLGELLAEVDARMEDIASAINTELFIHATVNPERYPGNSEEDPLVFCTVKKTLPTWYFLAVQPKDPSIHGEFTWDRKQPLTDFMSTPLSVLKVKEVQRGL